MQRSFDQHPSNMRFQLPMQQQRPQQPQHGVPQQGAGALQQLLDQQHAASQEHHRDGEQQQTLLLQRQQQQQLMRAQWKTLPPGQQAQQQQHRQQQQQQQQPHQAPALPSPLQHGSRPSSASGSGRNTPNDCPDGDYPKIPGESENPPPPSPPPPPYVFTSQQLESLKGQIATYRQLVNRMDQAKNERSVFVAKSLAQQQQQEIKIPSTPAPSMPSRESTSSNSGGAVLPPIVATKLPSSSYPTPSPSSASAGGGSVGGSPSPRWQSSGALRDSAPASGASSVPSLISRAIGDKSNKTGGGGSNGSSNNSGVNNDAPLPPLSSITGEASGIPITDPTRPSTLLMDPHRVGSERGFFNDGGVGLGSGRGPGVMAEAAAKVDPREKSLMGSLSGSAPATEGMGRMESGRFSVKAGERNVLEEEDDDDEEFVPTPVLRWRQANRAAVMGEDGVEGIGEGEGVSGTSSQNEYVASYGVYFPLHPMESAAPYPLASKVMKAMSVLHLRMGS